MRTLMFIAAGLALLGLCMVLTPSGKRAALAIGFIGVWLAVSGVNLGMGLSHGYSLQEELLVHLFLFGIPAASAAVLARYYSRRA